MESEGAKSECKEREYAWRTSEMIFIRNFLIFFITGAAIAPLQYVEAFPLYLLSYFTMIVSSSFWARKHEPDAP